MLLRARSKGEEGQMRYRQKEMLLTLKRRHFLKFSALSLLSPYYLLEKARGEESEKKSINSLPSPLLDPLTERKIEELTAILPDKIGTSERLDKISEQFLGTQYQENLLIGSEEKEEELVINLNQVDCLSFLEYCVALNRSTSRTMFIHELIRTRYFHQKISFLTRRHFFSDWWAETPQISRDITPEITYYHIQNIQYLNQKDKKGGRYLPGLPIKERLITHIPTAHVTNFLLQRVQLGDLIGIYTKKKGLDVVHTGFAIPSHHGLLFRNASSLKKNRKVIDTPLLDYIQNKDGLVIQRLIP